MPNGFQIEDEGKRYKAIILHPHLNSLKNKNKKSIESQIEEIIGLAKAIDLEILKTKTINIRKINPGSYLGKGSQDEIKALCKSLEPDVVIINTTLSPVQQRNLEKAFNTKIIDRTGLILEIFGERAQTKEGKIQVELAALEYQRSRLVRSWTHLERQRGGAGFMGGPGERQIELDRRIIGDKITKLKKDLEDVRRTRDLARKSRERVPYPVVALVGYTNAGKSTLFNRLTGANVFAKDLLFATLDPTMRKVSLDKGLEFIIADTVGFISELPTHLIAAFRATLEQVKYADVILHVRDISEEDSELHKKDVIAIMEDLGVEYEEDERLIEVLNKIDLIEEDDRNDILRKANFNNNIIPVSAIDGEGLDKLLELIGKRLKQFRSQVFYELNISDGKALSWLYSNSNVIDRIDSEKSIKIEVEIEPSDMKRFYDRFGYKSAVA
jgi:GTP-binding protein HflX